MVGAVAVQQQHQLPLQPEELLQLAQFGHQPQTGKEQGGGWDGDQTGHLISRSTRDTQDRYTVDRSGLGDSSSCR